MSAQPAPSPEPDDGWTYRRQGKCPLAKDTQVVIQYRNGMVVGPIKAGDRRWEPHKGQTEPDPFDIVAWRLS